MKSTDIISLFLERKDTHGVAGLTVKQVSWLVGQLSRENKISKIQGRSNSGILIQDSTGEFHRLVIFPNGAGFIRPNIEVTTAQAEPATEEMNNKYIEIIAKFREEGNEIAAKQLEDAVKASSKNRF